MVKTGPNKKGACLQASDILSILQEVEKLHYCVTGLMTTQRKIPKILLYIILLAAQQIPQVSLQNLMWKKLRSSEYLAVE